MSASIKLPRRRALSRLGAIAVAATATGSLAQARAPLSPTPRDAEGPFYPTIVPPQANADLTRVPGHARVAHGTRLAIGGRILATDGMPLAGTRVELWQCDSRGRYHHVDDDPAALDPDFQGYGAMTAAADGSYGFITIRPVPYSRRPPHLHFKLTHSKAQPLTTQLYPRGESAERGFALGTSGRDSRSRLEFVMQAAPGESLAATYDFVLAPA